MNAFEVRKRGRLPSGRICSGRIHKEKPGNEPQSIPMIKLRHLPEAGRLQVWIETLPNLTCCIFPNMIVEGA